MPKKEALTPRVARLENAMLAVSKNMKEMSEKMNILADAQIKTEQRFQQTDARIEKLVVAIGELISRMPAQPR